MMTRRDHIERAEDLAQTAQQCGTPEAAQLQATLALVHATLAGLVPAQVPKPSPMTLEDRARRESVFPFPRPS